MAYIFNDSVLNDDMVFHLKCWYSLQPNEGREHKHMEYKIKILQTNTRRDRSRDDQEKQQQTNIVQGTEDLTPG
jgi:hypothetical protein